MTPHHRDSHDKQNLKTGRHCQCKTPCSFYHSVHQKKLRNIGTEFISVHSSKQCKNSLLKNKIISPPCQRSPLAAEMFCLDRTLCASHSVVQEEGINSSTCSFVKYSFYVTRACEIHVHNTSLLVVTSSAAKLLRILNRASEFVPGQCWNANTTWTGLTGHLLDIQIQQKFIETTFRTAISLNTYL